MAIFTGKNVEDAIQNGLNKLGIPRLKARITVISKEKKGFLGFGKKPAQVEVSSLEDAQASDKKASSVTSIFKERPKSTTELDQKSLLGGSNPETTSSESAADELELEKLADTSDVSSPKEKSHVTEISDGLLLVEESHAQDKTTSETSEESRVDESLEPSVVSGSSLDVDVDEQSSDSKEPSDQAALQVTTYVQTILDEMDVEASITVAVHRRRINLQIETNEPGRVIGYHGKVLKALQLLAQNYLHDRYSRYYTVSINVHDYVEHRTEALIEFSHKMADRVLESGQPFQMDPMSNSERKVVHRAISQLEGVTSYSEGDDPNRYVVVTVSD